MGTYWFCTWQVDCSALYTRVVVGNRGWTVCMLSGTQNSRTTISNTTVVLKLVRQFPMQLSYVLQSTEPQLKGSQMPTLHFKVLAFSTDILSLANANSWKWANLILHLQSQSRQFTLTVDGAIFPAHIKPNISTRYRLHWLINSNLSKQTIHTLPLPP